MNVELICVGTELLLGNILNTNAKYISEKCAELGLSMFYQTVVGDNPDRLKDCILTALGRSDCIITSGGLGPTNDDLTKEIITEALGLKLVEDKETVDRLYYFFNKISRPGHSMTPNNLKQAMVPEGCTVLTNKNGTAPGILIEKDGKTVIMLPGPPRELVPLFEEYCIPYFLKKSDETIYSVMVKLVGIGESEAAARIDDILNNSTNPTVAPYAKTAEVHLRITAKAHDEEQAKAMIEPVFERIKDVLGPYIYST
ncbi:MAG: CinA family nicotinamide mononucleotide deamidase-related protein, partial [Lachnospiraceae bacterium]|nr:CinA family nicotinamide mononucleotide deamidase-related protein [Lachnospiraceae bacterium]